MAKVIHTSNSADVIKEDDGSYSVNTPISYERGFYCENDAVSFCKSYGYLDLRAMAASNKLPDSLNNKNAN